MMSRGESNTRCSANVSSTTPRLEPRGPAGLASQAHSGAPARDQDAAGATAVELDQEQPLPRAEGQMAVHDRDRELGHGGQQGPYVAVAVRPVTGHQVGLATGEIVVRP